MRAIKTGPSGYDVMPAQMAFQYAKSKKLPAVFWELLPLKAMTDWLSVPCTRMYNNGKRRKKIVIYVSGIHALNIPCSLETCGDWHSSALRWKDIDIRDSSKSIFGDYGIETGHRIPNHEGVYNVANTIRALLDLIDDGNFAQAQGMNSDFICNPVYNNEVFRKVYLLRNRNNWDEISAFMGKEYRMEWLRFLRREESHASE